MSRAILPVLSLLVACGNSPGTSQTPETTGPSTSESPTTGAPAAAPAVPAHLLQAVAAESRPAEDKERDADRKPAEVMSFFGVEPEMTVAELMAGKGYYAELLALAVGPKGVVYVHNSPFILERFADKPITERLAKPGLEHAVRWDREPEALEFPEGQLDVVMLVLFYHDTIWQGVDRPKLLAGVMRGLKPGGVFGVIDHHAATGAKDSVAKTLHRVEADFVKGEVLAAGFELAAESDLLRNPGDDRSLNVFDESLRGKTDRFIFKFVKPAP